MFLLAMVDVAETPPWMISLAPTGLTLVWPVPGIVVPGVEVQGVLVHRNGLAGKFFS